MVMRRNVLWLVLGASLAANVFFAAGVAYTVYTDRRVTESPAARVDLVAESLDLSPAQRTALEELRERAAIRHAGLREVGAPARMAILEQVAQPVFDRDRVVAAIRAWNEERTLYFATYAEDLHEYLMTLSPAQRRAFLDMAREPGFLRRVFVRPRALRRP